MMKNGKRYLLVAIALLLATVLFSGLAMADGEEAKPIKAIKFVDEKTDYEVELKGSPKGSKDVDYTLDPADADWDQYVEWTSSDKDIATVEYARLVGDNTVTVKSVKPGKVTITGVAKDKTNKPIAGVKEATFTVNFKEVAAESLNFNTYSERITLMKKGDYGIPEKRTGDLNELLYPSILPYTATYNMVYEKLAWSSSDPSTLLVKEDGSYTALKLGKVTVTATTTLGSKKLTNTAEIEIYQDPVKTATFVPEKFEIEPSDSPFDLEQYLKLDPDDAICKGYSFKSSDPEIFDGYNVGKKAGTVTVTAEILNYDGTKVTATCTVTVKPVALKALSFIKSSITLKPGNQDQY
jgi:alpha-L-fucosidase 2